MVVVVVVRDRVVCSGLQGFGGPRRETRTSVDALKKVLVVSVRAR